MVWSLILIVFNTVNLQFQGWFVPVSLRPFFRIAAPYVMARRRQWHPTPVLLPGKSHGRRSLVSCSPWGCKESDTTERLHFHFSLSCFGEGNGNPVQYSCLENPRDGGAWWAPVSGVAQSQPRLKRLSSSSMSWLRSGHCVVNFFHLVKASVSSKQFKGCGSGHYLVPLRRNYRSLTLLND